MGIINTEECLLAFTELLRQLSFTCYILGDAGVSRITIVGGYGSEWYRDSFVSS